MFPHSPTFHIHKSLAFPGAQPTTPPDFFFPTLDSLLFTSKRHLLSSVHRRTYTPRPQLFFFFFWFPTASWVTSLTFLPSPASTSPSLSTPKPRKRTHSQLRRVSTPSSNCVPLFLFLLHEVSFDIGYDHCRMLCDVTLCSILNCTTVFPRITSPLRTDIENSLPRITPREAHRIHSRSLSLTKVLQRFCQEWQDDNKKNNPSLQKLTVKLPGS